jgi:outer membrane protein OmpA-like peptidoglycan-associated protein
MIKYIFTLTWILISFFSAFSQSQWASSVIKYSSQAGYKAYSAKQAVGIPNALQSGKNPVAWSPQTANMGMEYIQVGFSNPQKVKQIAVWENFNPGAIYQIYLIEPNGKEHLVYELKQPEKITSLARMFRHSIKTTPFLVSELRLVLNTAGVFGLNQIDAIGISDSDEPMRTAINNPLDIDFIGKPENLGYAVNSQAPDLLPLISVDGQTLYFARKNHPDNYGSLKKDDIYVSKKNNKDQWTEPFNIGPPLNDDYNNFVCAVNPDGTEILVSGKYDQGEGLYKTSLIKGIWTKPQKIIIEGYTNSSLYVCYHVSPDMKYLVIAMEDQATYGDMDIYVSFRKSDGTYTKPKNVGPMINTAGTEPSVFLSADSKTIYFSSDGHPGYGAYDMYMSRRLDDTWNKWTTPVNLGPKINSDDWDLYYTVPANGEYAYYSSSNASYGESDLYRIKLPKDVRPEPVAILKPNYVNIKTNTPIAQVDKKTSAVIITDDSKLNLFQDIKGFYPVNEAEDLSAELEEVDSAPNEVKAAETKAVDPMDSKMNDLLARLQELKNEQAKTSTEINTIDQPTVKTTTPSKTNSVAPKNTQYTSELEDQLAALRSDMDKISKGEQPIAYKMEDAKSDYKVKPADKYAKLSESELAQKEALEAQLKALEDKQKALDSYENSNKYNYDVTPRQPETKSYDLRATDTENYLADHQTYRDRMEELKLAKEKSAYEPQPLTKYALKKTQIDEETNNDLVASSLKTELNQLKEKQTQTTAVNPEVDALQKKLDALKAQQATTTTAGLPTSSGNRITTKPTITEPSQQVETTNPAKETPVIVNDEVLAFQQKLDEIKNKMNNIPVEQDKNETPIVAVVEPTKPVVSVEKNKPVPKENEVKKRNNQPETEVVEVVTPILPKVVEPTLTLPNIETEIAKEIEEDKATIAQETAQNIEQKEQLKQDLNALNEETEAAKKAREDALAQKQSMELEKQTVLAEKEKLEAEKAAMAKQTQELQAVIDQLQKERDEFLADQAKLDAERAKLEAIRLKQFKEVKQLEQDIKTLQSEKSKVSAQVEEAKQNAPVASNVTIDKEIFLMPVEVGVKVEIRNIFFNANSAYVKAQSYKELDKIASFLQVNSNITIEIGGHTNGLCEDDFCNKLSANRAKSVAEYLVNKGIAANRIQYKGYGKSQPIADNNTDDGRKKNQRVELKILKIEN